LIWFKIEKVQDSENDKEPSNKTEEIIKPEDSSQLNIAENEKVDTDIQAQQEVNESKSLDQVESENNNSNSEIQQENNVDHGKI